MLRERLRIVLGCELPIPREEPFAQIGRADSFEVHGEEGDVGEDIAVAEPVVELDAVENAWAVVQAEDVVGEQVAVTVSDLSMSDAIGEERTSPVEIAPGELLDPGGDIRREDRADERLHRGEARLPVGAHAVDRGGCFDHRRGIGARMKGRDVTSYVSQTLVDGLVPADQRREPALVGHPSHHDQVVARQPVDTEHLGDAEVDVRGQAPVELDLPATDALAFSRGREVEEVELHRLLQFVDAITDEEHGRDMCLPHSRRRASPLSDMTTASAT